MSGKAGDRGPETGGQDPEAHQSPASSLQPSAHLSRLRWRCRRGMRELDVVLARYLEHDYPQTSEAHRQAFEALLAFQDPELLAVLLGRESLPADPDLAHVFKTLAQYRR